MLSFQAQKAQTYWTIKMLGGGGNEVSWQTQLEQMNLHLGLHRHTACFMETPVNRTAATSSGLHAAKKPFWKYLTLAEHLTHFLRFLHVFCNSFAQISFGLKLIVRGGGERSRFKGWALGSGPKEADEMMETEQSATETTGNKTQSKEASEKKVIWAGLKKAMWMLWKGPHFAALLITEDDISFCSYLCVLFSEIALGWRKWRVLGHFSTAHSWPHYDFLGAGIFPLPSMSAILPDFMKDAETKNWWNFFLIIQ